METIDISFANYREKSNISRIKNWFHGHSNIVMIVSMILSDLIGIGSAIFLAVLIRLIIVGPIIVNSYLLNTLLWSPVYFLIFVITNWTRGLYPGIRVSAIEQFRIISIDISLFYLMIIFVTFLFQVGGQISRFLIGVSWILSFFTVSFTRSFVRHILTKIGL